MTIASQLNNTLLLLEEPEVHQHIGAIKPLFKALLNISKENNLQLFISTHSLDLIKVITELQDTESKIFHTSLENGVFKTREISLNDTRLMTDLGIDIRLIGNKFKFLVLEGVEDKAFFNAVNKKILGRDLEELGYVVVLMDKSGQKNIARALASTGKDIAIQRDYDSEEKSSIIDAFSKTLKGIGECELTEQKLNVTSTGSTIQFILTGLPEDNDLKSIGITYHSMEYYLLKLLCIDGNVKEWAGLDIKALRQCADSLRDSASLNRSKTILAALGTIKDGLSTEELVNTMIDKAEKETLTSLLGSIATLI